MLNIYIYTCIYKNIELYTKYHIIYISQKYEYKCKRVYIYEKVYFLLYIFFIIYTYIYIYIYHRYQYIS